MKLFALDTGLNVVLDKTIGVILNPGMTSTRANTKGPPFIPL